MMTLFNTRLAIRNLIIMAVISAAYLFGKHLQAIHDAPGAGILKIRYSNNRQIPKSHE